MSTQCGLLPLFAYSIVCKLLQIFKEFIIIAISSIRVGCSPMIMVEILSEKVFYL